jgi:cytochrome P450
MFPLTRVGGSRPPPAYADLFTDRTPVAAEAADGSHVWLIGTHRQVKDVLVSDAVSTDPNVSAFPPIFPCKGGVTTRPRYRPLSAMDGHEHVIHRRRVAHEFSRAAIESASLRLRMRAAKFFVNADERIDDYERTLVTPYVHDALAAYFVEDDPALISLLEAYEWWQKDPVILGDSSRTFRAGLADLIRDRTGGDRNDRVARIARQYEGGDPDEVIAELVEVLGSILVAGMTTTISTICIGTKLLVDNPATVPTGDEPDDAQWHRVVEEILRASSVADLVTARTTREPIKMHGVIIPEKVGLIALNGAANHDPSVFANPERFDPDRNNLKQHLAFGHGAHLCLGRHLAAAIIGNFLERCFSRDVTLIRCQHRQSTAGQLDLFPLFNMSVGFRARAASHLR